MQHIVVEHLSQLLAGEGGAVQAVLTTILFSAGVQFCRVRMVWTIISYGCFTTSGDWLELVRQTEAF
jgi:hypothetical protein